MRIEIVRIVYPIEYAAAKEYLEEYLKFIGCIVVEYPVLSKDENEWKLLPIQDDRVFDVFLGYTQEADPYHVDCARLNIRRTYMGESVKSKSNFVIQHDDICNLFSQINDELFQKITYDTMFYYLQARRNLEVLAMAEVLQIPEAHVDHVKGMDYIRSMANGFWEVYHSVEDKCDYHSICASLNAINMINDISDRLNMSVEQLFAIKIQEYSFAQIYSEIFKRVRILLSRESPTVVLYLLLADLSKNESARGFKEREYYCKAIQLIKESTKREYAFVWYKLGRYFERENSIRKANDCYQKALKADKRFYPATFKLAQQATQERQYLQAIENYNQLIDSVFYGKSTDPTHTGQYPQWDILSLKELQYVYKTYIQLARLFIHNRREYSAKACIGKACLACSLFEEAKLVCFKDTEDKNSFLVYHKHSSPVWAMWKVLQQWSDYITKDDFVRHIVNIRLAKCEKDI